ncbi:MAG: MJ0042-type zinc finger domain-containing protein [Candidatus Deferrimicrobium sp.]
MAMVVACKFCRSQFRLNEALLKDAKAVRIRCGKCGGTIVIRNPEAHPIFPDIAVGLKGTDLPVERSMGIPWPLPKERMADGADLSNRIRYEPTSSAPEVESGPHPAREPETAQPTAPAEEPAGRDSATGSPAPPGNPEREDLPPAEIFIPPPVPDARLDLSPHPAEESIVAPEETAEDSSARPPYARFRTPLMMIAGLWILLLALGTLYFANGESGKKLFDKWFPLQGSKNTGSTAANPVYAIRDVKSHMEKGISGESLYIIQGTVANVGKGPGHGIRIQVTLLGKENKARTKTAVFVGNLIDNTMLLHMNRGGMDGTLGVQDGQEWVNRDFPAGTSLPFMVVYFDAQDNNVGPLLVKALDVNE